MKTTYKTEPNSIKIGDLVAIVHYLKVNQTINHNFEFHATDLDDPKNKMRVQGREILENAFSASYFKEEIKVTRTHRSFKVRKSSLEGLGMQEASPCRYTHDTFVVLQPLALRRGSYPLSPKGLAEYLCGLLHHSYLLLDQTV